MNARNDHTPKFRLSTAVLLAGLALLAGGCRLLPSAPLLDLNEARQQRQISQQAERDPFPSPSDVGLKPAE